MEQNNEEIYEVTNGISQSSTEDSKTVLDTNVGITKEIVENTNGKTQFVLNILRQNVCGSDFLLCVFFAALQSYKADECLRPFPYMYVANGQKNFAELVIWNY